MYFKSVEDANEVRSSIEHDRDEEEKAIAEKRPEAEIASLRKRHKILRRTIKISSLALNTSMKLLLKPKLNKESPTYRAELQQMFETYFNEKSLTDEVKRIITDEMKRIAPASP